MSTTINSAAAAAKTAATPATSSSNATEDKFLKMLIAQMKNQDPMSPMDNAQMTAQMAQISTVNGISQLNDTMKAFAGQFGALETLQGASLAGRSVLVSGNRLELAAGNAQGAYALASDADTVKVTVLDGSGKAVHTTQLGAQAAGSGAFEWNGKTDAGASAPEGSYTFRIEASSKGKPVEATTLAFGRVLGITPGAAGLSLDLGALGTRAFSDVKRIQ